MFLLHCGVAVVSKNALFQVRNFPSSLAAGVFIRDDVGMFSSACFLVFEIIQSYILRCCNFSPVVC